MASHIRNEWNRPLWRKNAKKNFYHKNISKNLLFKCLNFLEDLYSKKLICFSEARFKKKHYDYINRSTPIKSEIFLFNNDEVSKKMSYFVSNDCVVLSDLNGIEKSLHPTIFLALAITSCLSA